MSDNSTNDMLHVDRAIEQQLDYVLQEMGVKYTKFVFLHTTSIGYDIRGSHMLHVVVDYIAEAISDTTRVKLSKSKTE